VYNTETDHCREVTITPNGAWGGDGSLGCGIGYGYLHRIPNDEEYPAPPPVVEAATVASTPLVSAAPTVVTPTIAPDQPLKPDVPIFGTEASPAPASLPPPSLVDTPHEMIPASPPDSVLDPAVMAGMPQPDPASLAASLASVMTMSPVPAPAITTPAGTVPVSPVMAASTPANPLATAPLMTPAPVGISAGPVSGVMTSTPMAGVTGLDPAVLAGMPPPDPAVLAAMNFSMPPAATQQATSS